MQGRYRCLQLNYLAFETNETLDHGQRRECQAHYLLFEIDNNFRWVLPRVRLKGLGHRGVLEHC
jgi:hypothetical protein